MINSNNLARPGRKVFLICASVSIILYTTLARADQVILDDLIVDGSACIGQDCVNGESFGFDTIRLKENNLRIKFQDTSSTASFPTNDWQITANDSSNGGQNKFSIDDIDGGRTPFTIEAGSPSHSLYVEDGGRVGFGTSTPVVDLHVKSGNTPTLRLEQDGSSGFTPQTWDAAGNEANFFIRDASNGSTLPFRIFPSAPSNALVIEGSTGDIGIGTTSPEAGHAVDTLVEVKSTGISTLSLDAGNGTGYGEVLFQENNQDRWSVIVDPDGSRFVMLNWGRLSYDLVLNNSDGYLGLGGQNSPAHPIHHGNGAYLSAGGSWQNASSRELKDDVRELTSSEATLALMDLKPVKFRYKSEPESDYVGFIAEDVPELVASSDHKSLSSMDIVAVLTTVAKEQQALIERLEKRISELESNSQQ